jgi:hypothetical protein
VSLIHGTRAALLSPLTTKRCPSISSSLPIILICASQTKPTVRASPMQDRPRLNGLRSSLTNTKELIFTLRLRTKRHLKSSFSDKWVISIY